jgi:hypothetical protein
LTNYWWLSREIIAPYRINDVRNALAHGLYPEERRRYWAHKKVMYDGADIFSKDGVEKFTKEVDLVFKYLYKRAFGTKP